MMFSEANFEVFWSGYIFRILGDLILTGCYDNTVNIFGIDGDKKLVIPGHSGPVKVRLYIFSVAEPVDYCEAPAQAF
jgi:hypothetical protein